MAGKIPDGMVAEIERRGGFKAEPEQVVAARFAASCPTVEAVRRRYPAHVARYEHAADRISDGTHGASLIIDAGSGVGYGAYVLAEAIVGANVWALERNPVLCGYAMLHYAHSRILWVRADLTARPWPIIPEPGSVDAFVCLETLERFTDPAPLLADAARVLRPEGLLVLSTPHKPQGNPYHAREYTLAEVEDALAAQGFGVLSLERQHPATGRFSPLDRAADLRGAYMFFVATKAQAR